MEVIRCLESFLPCGLVDIHNGINITRFKIHVSRDRLVYPFLCARCDFDRACLGVRRDYLAQHGDAELVPLRLGTSAP